MSLMREQQLLKTTLQNTMFSFSVFRLTLSLSPTHREKTAPDFILNQVAENDANAL